MRIGASFRQEGILAKWFRSALIGVNRRRRAGLIAEGDDTPAGRLIPVNSWRCPARKVL